MQRLVPPAGFLPTLLFDPNMSNARSIERKLATKAVPGKVADCADSLLQAVRAEYFRVVVVVAELGNENCLAFLDSVRRAAPRSWMIVANTEVDSERLAVAHRHGGDGLVAVPVDIDDLAFRIASLQARGRPLY